MTTPDPSAHEALPPAWAVRRRQVRGVLAPHRAPLRAALVLLALELTFVRDWPRWLTRPLLHAAFWLRWRDRAARAAADRVIAGALSDTLREVLLAHGHPLPPGL